MEPSTFYEHSGKAPLSGILLTLIGGLIAAVFLGALYGFLIFWIPFVYINVFITLGCGALLAMSVGGLAKIGKLRNTGVVTVLALLVSLVAYYVHWVVWLGRMTEVYILLPGELWGFMSVINLMGPWSIFGWTATGFGLWLIWAIEALMIIGLGTLSAGGVIDTPYCEETGQWTKENTMATKFAPLDSPAIESAASLVRALRPNEGSPQAYTEVAVSTAEGSELRCASVTSVSVETDKDGKEDTKKESVAKHLMLDRASYERILLLGQMQATDATDTAEAAGA